MKKQEPIYSIETRKQLLRNHVNEIVKTVQPNSNTSLPGLILAVVAHLYAEQTHMFEDVCDFHHKFGIAYSGDPRMLPPIEYRARLQRMREEIDEYEAACEKYLEAAEVQDTAKMDLALEEMIDALVDAAYFIFGTAHLHGFQFWNESWNRVHSKNMEKERSSKENPGKHAANEETGFCDIVKPKGWTPPRHDDLVKGIENGK